MINLDFFDNQYFPETTPTGTYEEGHAMRAGTGFYQQPADTTSRPEWDPGKNPTAQIWI